MTSIDHLKGILCLSAGVWGLCCLFTGLSIQRFIIKRYEDETDLSQTMYFTQFMPFAKYLPNFFSAPLYSGHLLTIVWGWRYVEFVKRKRKKIKYFEDISRPEDITRHFSKKEIGRVKRFAIIGFIVIIHIIAYYVFQSIWPELFD